MTAVLWEAARVVHRYCGRQHGGHCEVASTGPLAKAIEPLVHRRSDLAGEDLGIAEVVAGGGERGRVGGEGDRRQAGPGGLEAHGELGRDVLGVGGAAAVAAEEELAPGPEHRYHRLGKPRGRTEEGPGPFEGGEMIAIETVKQGCHGCVTEGQGCSAFTGRFKGKTSLLRHGC